MQHTPRVKCSIFPFFQSLFFGCGQVRGEGSVNIRDEMDKTVGRPKLAGIEVTSR